jgi:hypothetical protein
MLLIDEAPVVEPHLECFVFPDEEGFMINNSRLNDLLSCKDTPSNCIDIVILNVLDLLARSVNSLVGHLFMLLKDLDQWCEQILMNEELEVSLLVNISIIWTPTELWITRADAVHCWLRVNCQ